MRILSTALCLTLLSGCSLLQQKQAAPASEASPPEIRAKLAVAAPQVTAAPPNSMTVPVGYNLTVSWDAVTTYTNGALLNKVPTYKLYTFNPSAGTNGFQGYLGNVLSTQRVQTVEGQKCYRISAQVYDPNANESALTVPICVLVQGTAPPVTVPPGQPTPVCVK